MAVLQSVPGGPHLPSGPLPLPRCGRGRGRVPPHQPPASPQLTPPPQRGSGAEGEGGPHLSPGPLPLPRCGRGRGGCLLTNLLPLPSSPRSRTAGAGPGVRAALTFPLSLPWWERKGGVSTADMEYSLLSHFSVTMPCPVSTVWGGDRTMLRSSPLPFLLSLLTVLHGASTCRLRLRQ